tara:strand:- start:1106 stop:1330 length:225 start_codon:yes stop_codon:yes gene_type:complete
MRSLNEIDDMFMKVLEQSNLDPETKYIINKIVETDFDGDWNKLLEDMMHHAVSDEEYELAAEIRDYLKKHSENG